MSAPEVEINLSKKAHDYLASLSPLAAKVNLDIEEVIESYQEYWTSLKPKEKEKLIDEALIKSDITLKYFDKFGSRSESSESLDKSGYKFDGKNLLSYFKQKTGRKLVQDEVIGKYRDEHSEPFSVSSRSQQNLRCFSVEEETQELPSEDYNKVLSQKLAQEAIKRAIMLSPLTRPKEQPPAIPTIDSNISYNKIKDDTDVDGNFISKFINRLSTTNGGGAGVVTNLLKDDEQENLVSNINLSLSTQHSEDSEDELHHTEKSLEFKSLLEKDFDFLNNW